MVNLTSNIKDTTGKFLVGSAGMYFYISPTSVTDTVQPTVAGIAPSNTSTNIGDNALIQLSFSKHINPLTINSSTVNVSGGAYTVTPASVAYDSTNQNLAITPLAPLPDNTAFTVSISNVTDPQGNIVVPFSSTFTTGPGPDVTPAVVVSVSVEQNSTVPQNTVFTLTFDKPVNIATLMVPTNFYLYDSNTGTNIAVNRSVSANGLSATLVPVANLPAGHQVRLSLSGANDLSGNAISTSYYPVNVSSAPDTVPA